jgi:branched-chain amino acid transport system substrate-binding protein
MKHQIKRNLVLLLVVVCTIATVLAGCSGSTGGGSTGGGSTSAGGSASTGNSDSTPAPTGDTIKIGYVAPFTGPLSTHTQVTKWASDKVLKIVNDEQGGIEVDGVKKKIEIIYADSESDPNKASEAASKLCTEDKVNILVGAWTPDTSMPVSGVGERYKVPTYINNSPAQSWLQGGPYYWAMGSMFDSYGMLTSYIGAWDKIDTNKRVGFVFDSEVDGVTWSAWLKENLPGYGYTVGYDGDRFPKGTNDFTNIIAQYKANDCDILIANMTNPEFKIFWSQLNASGYMPKVMTMGKGIQFVEDADALAPDSADGLITELHFTRDFPYVSPLLNKNAADLMDEWVAEKQTQAPMTMGYDFSTLEILMDSLQRAGTTEPEALRTAILATELDTLYGHMSFTEEQVAYTPNVTVQWLAGGDWTYTPYTVATPNFPEIKAAQDPIILPNTTQK